MDLAQDVEGVERLEVEFAVAAQDGVIEADDIETDDEVGLFQVFDKPVDAFFEIRRAVLLVAVPDDADGDAHHVGLVPAADFRCGALRRRAHDSRPRGCDAA